MQENAESARAEIAHPDYVGPRWQIYTEGAPLSYEWKIGVALQGKPPVENEQCSWYKVVSQSIYYMSFYQQPTKHYITEGIPEWTWEAYVDIARKLMVELNRELSIKEQKVRRRLQEEG